MQIVAWNEKSCLKYEKLPKRCRATCGKPCKQRMHLRDVNNKIVSHQKFSLKIVKVCFRLLILNLHVHTKKGFLPIVFSPSKRKVKLALLCFTLREQDDCQVRFFSSSFSIFFLLGPIQTSNFSCAESNVYEQNLLFKLICIWFGAWKVRRLNRALPSSGVGGWRPSCRYSFHQSAAWPFVWMNSGASMANSWHLFVKSSSFCRLKLVLFNYKIDELNHKVDEGKLQQHIARNSKVILIPNRQL